MKNCIIIGNRAGTIGGDQIATSLSTIIASMKLIVRNCCIQSALSKDIFPVHSSAITIEDTIFLAEPYFAKPGYWANVCDPNIIVEPDEPNAFWIQGDYHLKSQAGRYDPNSGSWVMDDVTSLCIDAGDPNSPIGDEPFPNGGIINMGAYGGTGEASKSYFGEPPCDTIIAGDINGDCKVDLKDFTLFANNWLKDNRN
jgi:hypothetical protein